MSKFKVEKQRVIPRAYVGTDELLVEFWSCACGFERIPRATPDTDDDEGSLTANYCPGCGYAVEWADAPER